MWPHRYWVMIDIEPYWELTEEEIGIMGNPSQGTDPSLPPSPALLSSDPTVTFLSRFILLSVLCIYVCACVGLCMWAQVPEEVKRRCQIPWNWSYRPLWPPMWILGTELQSKQQVLLNYWSISPASDFAFQWRINCKLVPPCSLGYHTQDTKPLQEFFFPLSLGPFPPSQSSLYWITSLNFLSSLCQVEDSVK